jgi:hypothetical protein
LCSNHNGVASFCSIFYHSKHYLLPTVLKRGRGKNRVRTKEKECTIKPVDHARYNREFTRSQLTVVAVYSHHIVYFATSLVSHLPFYNQSWSNQSKSKATSTLQSPITNRIMSSSSNNADANQTSGGDYSVTGHGTNDQGNHYCTRDYGDSGNNNAYHYSNR